MDVNFIPHDHSKLKMYQNEMYTHESSYVQSHKTKKNLVDVDFIPQSHIYILIEMYQNEMYILIGINQVLVATY